MLPGPIVRRELKAAALRRGQYPARTVLGLALAAMATIPLLTTFRWGGAVVHHFERQDLRAVGAFTLGGLAVIEVLILAFVLPAQVGGAIAEEWEQNTLPNLLLSRLTRLEIVLAKLVGRLLPGVSLALIGLPLLIPAAWIAGFPSRAVVLIATALVSTVVMIGALSIFASARNREAGKGRSQATGLVAAWLVLPPIIAILPLRWPAPWDEVGSAIKSACAFVASSSPVSLVTNSAWAWSRGFEAFQERILLMVALQAGVSLLAVLGAAASLGARERYPYWWDPYRGFRPKCEDDPIVWREYALPNRQGSAPRPVILLRYLVSLVITLLTVALRLLAVLLALAIPVGLIVATVWFGYPAAVEWWRYGGDPYAPFRARDTFNVFVRIATAILTFTTLAATTAAESRISLERSKGTWLILLTTPLTGGEILGSKIRVTLLMLRPMAWLLVAVWLAGVACGSVNVLGPIVAAVDLAVAAWAGVTLGTLLGVRPGSQASANTFGALASIVLLLIHVPLIVAALASGRQLQWVLAADPRLPWLVLLCGIVVPSLTAWMAWSMKRTAVRHFDEWVGRPHREPSAPSRIPESPPLGTTRGTPLPETAV